MPGRPNLENRFELYFFFYYVSFALTSRLHSEYVSSLTLAEIYKGERSETNLTFYDKYNHLESVKPKEIVETLCEEYPRQQAEDKIERIFSEINYNYMLTDAAFKIPSALVTVLFGLVSDYVGKRRFLLVMACSSISLYSMLLILHYYGGGTTGSLTAIAVLCGFLGIDSAAIVSLITYVADITKPQKRFFVMSVSVTFVKLAYTIADGPLTYWVHAKGFQQVMWCIFAINYFNFKMITQGLTESQATNIEYRSLNIWGFLGWVKHMSTKEEGDEKSAFGDIFDKYFNLILAGFCSLTFITQSYQFQLYYFGTSQLDCQDSDFGEGPLRIAQFNAFIMIAFHCFGFLGSLVITLVLLRVKREIPIGLLGIVSTVVGLVVLPFSTSSLLVAIALLLMCLHVVPITLYLTLSSKHTSPQTQALALSTLLGCSTVAALLAHVFNYHLHYRVTGYQQQRLFWLYAALLIVPTALLLALGLYTKRNKRKATWANINKEVDVSDTEMLT